MGSLGQSVSPLFTPHSSPVSFQPLSYSLPLHSLYSGPFSACPCSNLLLLLGALCWLGTKAERSSMRLQQTLAASSRNCKWCLQASWMSEDPAELQECMAMLPDS
ncbi:cyclic AMP-responsive element-binding protein 3-like protein 4 [Platysternon megacephalum]|uniref:Cyclic AMP-responsive element-binding protein 3-like protein 4 n=1 Tax=Platysternon megacephalum TaxID=55544 RepID=A0A4D9DWM8_9SAUR|nr:cyclic AMP-responsive element-binding protein 3-like protein 4 [Platysternon megacephalum]